MSRKKERVIEIMQEELVRVRSMNAGAGSKKAQTQMRVKIRQLFSNEEPFFSNLYKKVAF
jgi:hypothetical protein